VAARVATALAPRIGELIQSGRGHPWNPRGRPEPSPHSDEPEDFTRDGVPAEEFSEPGPEALEHVERHLRGGGAMVHESLVEQRDGTFLGRGGFEVPVDANGLAGGAEDGGQGDGDGADDDMQSRRSG
jgi:hypothetical protein